MSSSVLVNSITILFKFPVRPHLLRVRNPHIVEAAGEFALRFGIEEEPHPMSHLLGGQALARLPIDIERDLRSVPADGEFVRGRHAAALDERVGVIGLGVMSYVSRHRSI